MSVNFSQKVPDYSQNQNSFGVVNVQEVAPQEQMNMLKAMELPSNKDEFVKWLPYFSTAVGASVLISKLTKMATTLNPAKNPTVTVEDSFNRSVIGRATAKVDKYTIPLLNQLSQKFSSIRTKISQVTPKYFKDLYKNVVEKFGIGMAPKNRLAAGQSRGFSIMTADDVIRSFTDLRAKTPDAINKLGIGSILDNIASKKLDQKAAIKVLSEHFKNSKITVQEFNKLVGNSSVLTQLNVAKSFVGNNAKSKFSKLLQKFFMYNAEGAGGGVAGGMLFGTLMNSIFLASTIKRTWNAPWGDKFSTFMEGALCDFCGGMLVNMVIAPRLAYKILGLKNLDKSAHQLKRIKQLDTAIRTAQEEHKLLLKMISTKDPRFIAANSGFLVKLCKRYNLKMPSTGSLSDLQKSLTVISEKSALKINNSIGKLGKARAFKSQGFLKDIIHAPLHFIGKIANVGLETLPAKVKGKMLVNGKLKNISSFGVFRNKLGNFFKGAAGYWRFIFVTTIVGAPIMNFIAKFSHTVFGTPKKCYYGKEAEEQEKSTQQQLPQQQEPQIDKMQAFSEVTKQLGKMREAQQPMKLPPDYNPQISQTLVNSTINNQRNKLDTSSSIDASKNLSPATYVPSPIASQIVDTDMQNAISAQINKSMRIENAANVALSALNAKENPYQF